MSNWPIRTIAECADDEPYATQIGPFGKALTPKAYQLTGVPLLRGVNVNHGRFHDDDFVFISEADADRLAKFESFPGDVLLVHKGTLGKIGLMPTTRRFARYIMGNSMLRVRCHPARLIPEYLYYWLSSAAGTQYLLSRVSQVGVPQIQRPLTTLREAQLPVPPLVEQRTIVGVLGALDDKMEQNRYTAQSLERLARAIFRAWFVDFEPVKAKAAGATAFPSMPQPVFDTLTTHFVDSTVGPIPCGWEVSTVGDCTSYLNRGIPPRYLEEVGVLVLNQKCIRDFAIDYGKARRHDTSSRGIEGREIKVGDVLINSTGVGTLGRLAQVLHLPEPAIVDTHVTVVRPSSRLNTSYFGQALTFMQPLIESLGEGSTGQTELNRGKILELKLLAPTMQLLNAFQDIAAPLMMLASQTRVESQSLAKLRDYLLPKLISGDVQVLTEGESSSG